MAEKDKKDAAPKGKSANAIRMMALCVLLLAAVFLPSTIVIFVCMLPSLVAALVDQQTQRTAWITVGAMNFAGTLPAWFDLWEKGHTVSAAFHTVTEPLVLLIAFGGAAIGLVIYHNVTPLVAVAVVGKNEKRLKTIAKRQKELVKKWGEDVTR